MNRGRKKMIQQKTISDVSQLKGNWDILAMSFEDTVKNFEKQIKSVSDSF